MRNWKFVYLALLAINIFGAKTFAGNEGSGGGNAIVCFDNKNIAAEIRADKVGGGGYIDDSHIPHIVSVELLDIHKAQLGIFNSDGDIVYPKIINSRPGETSGEYRTRLLSRFGDLIPSLASYLKGPRTELPVKAFPHGISPIDDVLSGEMFPANCVRSTIIAQFSEEIKDIKDCEKDRNGYYKEGYLEACALLKTYIAVDQRIYNLPENIFPASSRVLSYWHEYFYHLARLIKNTSNSDTVQSFVGSLITEDITLKDVLGKMYRAIGTTSFDLYFDKILKALVNEMEQNKIQKFSVEIKYKKSGNNSMEVLRKAAEEKAKPIQQKILNLYVEKYRPQLMSLKWVPTETLIKFDTYLQTKWINRDAFERFETCGFAPSKFSDERTCVFMYKYSYGRILENISQLPEAERFNLLDVKLPNAVDL